MNLSKSTKLKMAAFLGFIGLILLYFIAHMVHVYDLAHAGGSSGISWVGGGKSMSARDAVIPGIEEAISDPFNFKGIKFIDLLKAAVPVFSVAGFLLWSRYLRSKDRRTEIKTVLDNASRWFGQSTALIRGDKTFVDKHMVKDKKTGEEHMVEETKTMPECDYYHYKYVCPYTQADKNMGLPDPNILLGKHQPTDNYKKTKDPDHNIIKYSLDVSRHEHNLNTLIMGGSGTGKTFRWLEPNLAQLNSSFAITDPSGEIFQNMGRMLLEDGYRVWVFSTKDPRHSNC